MKYILIVTFLISSLFAFEYKVSSTTTANAKTIYIEFTKERAINFDKLVVGKRSYSIFNHPLDNSKMYALLPFSYYQSP